jgi:hypothetical protein
VRRKLDGQHMRDQASARAAKPNYGHRIQAPNRSMQRAFGFAEAIFIKYFGELTATVVAQFEDAPKIEDLRLPWFLETTSFSPDGEAQ